MNAPPDDQRYGTIEAVLGAWAEDGPAAEALVASCLATVKRDGEYALPLNVMRWINPRAQADAAAVDRQGLDFKKPLHGVPLVLKDNIDVFGVPTTSGNVAMAGAMPRADAGLVERLHEAGAVILGKTNLSEFSFEIRSRSSLAGDVLNPFDRRVTAGGSSGGAAAAVAAGFALAAIGTDTGGSIRTPASFNGLVGVRPTHGLIDPSGVAPLAPSTDTVGALTRSVSDARRLLEVLAGGRYADIGLDLSAVRVGAFRQAFGKDPIIVAAVEAVLSRVSALGATILDPMLLPEPLLDFSGDHIVDWEFCQAFDHYLSKNFISGAPESVASILASGEFLPEYRDTLRKRLGLGGLDNPIYRGVLASHERLTNGLSELFRAHGLDALVYPTSIVVPSSLDNPKGGWAPELAARSGRPAITLPVAQADTGIPIGLELLGGRHEEAALLNLAAGFERVIGRRFLPLT